MNLSYLFHSFLCGGILLCLPNSILFGIDNGESRVYRALLADAYQGKWFVMRNKSLPYEGFIQKNGKQRLDGSSRAYTGWYAQFDGNNTARLLCSFYEGVREGPLVQWNKLGTISLRGAYQLGRKHGVFTSWGEKGVRISEQEYKNGKLDGWSYFWYDGNILRLRLLFERGKLIEAKGWLPNGEICPHTRVEDGSGVIINHESALSLPSEINNYLKSETQEGLED